MILGTTTPGGTPTNLTFGTMHVHKVEIPEGDWFMGMIGVMLDGQGPDAGSAEARVHAVLYDSDEQLVATGPDVVIASGAAPAWVTLRCDPSGAKVTGEVWLGVRADKPGGGAGQIIRLLTEATGGDAMTVPAGPGAPEDLSSGVASTKDATIFCDIFAEWARPDVEDSALARLPFNVTQRVFNETAPVAAAPRLATAGWYGTFTDPERTANCIVRSDGPLADLVGERLRITYLDGTNARSVVVYCHDEQEFPTEVGDEDMSLTKCAMQRLAPLPRDSIPITVEVMG